jgi:hypothetical protein
MKKPVIPKLAAAGLALAATLALAPSAFTQGAPQGGNPAPAWLRHAKQLGLQTAYAADMEMQSLGMTMPAKIFQRDGQSRVEMTLPRMNNMVTLQLVENGKPATYLLLPDRKKYCLVPEPAAEAGAEPADATLTDAGAEVFEGVTCQKKRLTVKLAEGTQTMDLLLSPAQKNMPVKISSTAQVPTVGAVTSVILFKNYNFNPPDAALFVIPADYTKAGNLQEAMLGVAAPTPSPEQTPALPPAAQAEAEQALREAQTELENETRSTANEEKKKAIQEGVQSLKRGLFGR